MRKEELVIAHLKSGNFRVLKHICCNIDKDGRINTPKDSFDFNFTDESGKNVTDWAFQLSHWPGSQNHEASAFYHLLFSNNKPCAYYQENPHEKVVSEYIQRASNLEYLQAALFVKDVQKQYQIKPGFDYDYINNDVKNIVDLIFERGYVNNPPLEHAKLVYAKLIELKQSTYFYQVAAQVDDLIKAGDWEKITKIYQHQKQQQFIEYNPAWLNTRYTKNPQSSWNLADIAFATGYAAVNTRSSAWRLYELLRQDGFKTTYPKFDLNTYPLARESKLFSHAKKNNWHNVFASCTFNGTINPDVNLSISDSECHYWQIKHFAAFYLFYDTNATEEQKSHAKNMLEVLGHPTPLETCFMLAQQDINWDLVINAIDMDHVDTTEMSPFHETQGYLLNYALENEQASYAHQIISLSSNPDACLKLAVQHAIKHQLWHQIEYALDNKIFDVDYIQKFETNFAPPSLLDKLHPERKLLAQDATEELAAILSSKARLDDSETDKQSSIPDRPKTAIVFDPRFKRNNDNNNNDKDTTLHIPLPRHSKSV